MARMCKDKKLQPSTPYREINDMGVTNFSSQCTTGNKEFSHFSNPDLQQHNLPGVSSVIVRNLGKDYFFINIYAAFTKSQK